MDQQVYRADPSLKGKLRRRLARLYRRRPATRPLERPMVSFAFDDAPASAARAGAEILEARGLRGAYFICAGLAGRTAHMGPYATREDVLRLVEAGHEIACHTYSHLDCGKADVGAIEVELDRNAEALAAWGVPRLATFAYPYGDVSPAAKRATARRFTCARALHRGLIGPGSDLNQAPAVGIEGQDGEALARRWLARAEPRKAWLILFTHAVEAEPTPFGASRDALGRLADAALARGFEVVTVAEGARRMRATA